MERVWKQANQNIAEILDRIMTIGGKGKSDLMWVAYRDYSDNSPVEASQWSSHARTLQRFVEGISCEGGDDFPEAVELGLKKANDAMGATRVILIGDAPPHMERKGTMLKAHKVVMPTDYIEQVCISSLLFFSVYMIVQAQQLAAKRIPVYCFYINNTFVEDLQKSFKEIASITGKIILFLYSLCFFSQRYTGGKVAPLTDVNNLVDIIVKTVVDDIGGDSLVEEYRKTYHS